MTTVRSFRQEDAAALATIFYTAVREVGALYYSPEQVRAWAPAPAEPSTYFGWAGNRTVLVAVDEADIPLAYGDLEEDGHIDHFYCRPGHTRAGVSIILYDAIEALARGNGLDRLKVEASEPARRFFERRGFHTIERREFSLRGVMIHNFLMDKRLS